MAFINSRRVIAGHYYHIRQVQAALVVVTGRVDLETKCVALQSNLGDLQFEFDGPLYELPGFAHLAWRLVDAAGQVHMTGFDAAVIENGLIADLWTVVIPPQ